MGNGDREESGVKCPECDQDLGTSARRVYKHALSCFHLEDRGAESLIRDLSSTDSVYSRRALALLRYAQERGE